METPFIIAISGGSGSGKTMLARSLSYHLKRPVSIISFDSYYKDQKDIPLEARRKINYDSPDSLDMELFIEHLKEIKQGHKIQIPIYDFAQYTRSDLAKAFRPKEIVIVEGILLFELPMKYFDMTVFVDADPDVRLARRIVRDNATRGRTLTSIVSQYLSNVKPMHELYVEPHKKEADFIFSNNGNHGISSEKVEELIAFINKRLGE